MYEAYTLSDQVWTPQLPAHWEFQRAKCIFDSPKEKNEGNKESNVLSLTLKGVIHNSKENPIGLSPADYATYQIFEANDLVFKLIDLENVSTSRVGIVPERGIMSSAYIRFSARKEINVRYFYYQYHDWWLRQIFNGLGAGVRQTLSAQDLLNLKLAVPPRNEQDQIVRYLDWQVSKINHLIHGYQKQIKLLEERKLTILDQLVHNGILASEFKEYDIEYIGKVPAHWHVLQNHRIFESAKRKFEGVPTVLSLSQKDGLIPYSELNERTLHTASYDNWQLVHENDLVLNRFKAHLGVFYASKYTGIVTFHYGVYKPKMPLLSKYYETLYHTQVYKRVYAGQSKGMTIGLQNLSDTDFYSVYTLYPPYDEQVAIVREIESVEEKFLKIRAGIMKQIELLKEYRTRLISDVVTGQIDVRDVVIPEYTPEEDADIDTDDAGEDVEEVAEDAE